MELLDNLMLGLATAATLQNLMYCFIGVFLGTFIGVLPGVGPLASARTATWIRNNVPGIHIPDSIIKRLEGAKEPKQEGRRICVELIQQIREIDGISGVHVMAYRQEESVAEIIQQSGVLDGRVPWYPGCDLQSDPAASAGSRSIERDKVES